MIPTSDDAAISEIRIALEVSTLESRFEETNAPLSPIPRINAMSTMANAWREAPKISDRERAASTSRPIDTAPVTVTRITADLHGIAGLALSSDCVRPATLTG